MKMRISYVLSAAVFLIFSATTQAAFDHQHKAWTTVLSKYRTSEGWVRYKQLKKDLKVDSKHAFPDYLKTLSGVSFKDYQGWNREQKMAFLINAYNAFTFKLIIDNYPVSSIKKTVGWFSSPWKKEFFSLLGGKIDTLDEIEHDWLRPKFKDARVHAAVNCASISCPVLHPVAFVPKKLDKQLQTAFVGFLKDKDRNRYEPKKGVLHLSEIFDWFEEDFEKSYGSVKKCIQKLGPPEAKQALAKKGKIKYLDYNWGLNEAKKAAAAVANQGG